MIMEGKRKGRKQVKSEIPGHTEYNPTVNLEYKLFHVIILFRHFYIT